jgi:hypothetical protein
VLSLSSPASSEKGRSVGKRSELIDHQDRLIETERALLAPSQDFDHDRNLHRARGVKRGVWRQRKAVACLKVDVATPTTAPGLAAMR